MTYLKTALSILIAGAMATSAPAGTPTVSVGGCSASDGERVCVPVTLSSDGTSAASAGFTLTYDTAAMRLPGGAADVVGGAALAGHSLAARVTEDPNLTESGRVQVVITAPPQIPIPTLKDGTLCEVCFTVPAGSPQGCQAPRLTAVDLGSDTGTDLPVRAVSQAGGSPGGCEIAATIASIDCRLSAAIAAVSSREDLGPLQRRLSNALARAQARLAKAQTYLEKGDGRRAGATLGQAVKQLQQAESAVGSPSSKKRVSAPTRTSLLNLVGPILRDAATLRGSI